MGAETLKYLPGALNDRRRQLDEEYEDYRRTGTLDDELSPLMGFGKSVAFGAADIGHTVGEMGLVIADVGAGTFEAGFNLGVYIRGGDDYLHIPELSQAAEAIRDHYAAGGTYGEAASAGVQGALEFGGTLGIWPTVQGAREWYETGNPVAWRDAATGQFLLSLALLGAEPVVTRPPPTGSPFAGSPFAPPTGSPFAPSGPQPPPPLPGIGPGPGRPVGPYYPPPTYRPFGRPSGPYQRLPSLPEPRPPTFPDPPPSFSPGPKPSVNY